MLVVVAMPSSVLRGDGDVDVPSGSGAAQAAEAADGGGLGQGPSRRQAWRRFATPALLVLLNEEAAHGYGLLARLPELFPSVAEVPDAGSIYRLLRVLEAQGVVDSSWDAAGNGARRRVYSLTDAGRAQIATWSGAVEREVDSLRRLLTVLRCAVPPAEPTDPRSA